MKWRYYRGELLVPEGMMFFYAHEALRMTWGESPGNPDPATPSAYQRLTSAECAERDTVLRSALGRVDEALERSQSLHAQGHVVAAIGLLKYVDLLLAGFNLALAQNEPHVRRTRRGCSEDEAATMARPDDAVRVTASGHNQPRHQARDTRPEAGLDPRVAAHLPFATSTTRPHSAPIGRRRPLQSAEAVAQSLAKVTVTVMVDEKAVERTI